MFYNPQWVVFSIAMFYHPQWVVFSIAMFYHPQWVVFSIAEHCYSLAHEGWGGQGVETDSNSPLCSGKVMFVGKELTWKGLPFPLPVKMDFCNSGLF